MNPVLEMNKKTFEKLRIQKPEYYDATDGRAVVMQMPQLEKAFVSNFWYGFEVAGLLGVLGIGLTALGALVTAPTFVDRLGVNGATWNAIFVIILVASAISFVLLGVRLWRNKPSKPQDFFKDQNRINHGKSQNSKHS